MADPLLSLLFPMETMIPQSPPPILRYTITLDIPTSLIFSFTIILFFLFLFHILNGFLQWFLDIRDSDNHRDLELGESETYDAAQNNVWILGMYERLVSTFEERRFHRMRVLAKLPPLVCFENQKLVRSSSNECAICLEEFMNEESNCQVLPGCNHIFHSNCIDVWLRKKLTCPVCRRCILDS